MIRAVFLDYLSVDPGDLDAQCLADSVDHIDFYEHSTGAEILQRCVGYDVVMTNKCKLDAGFFASCKGLKLVCVAATGVNNIDLEAAQKHAVVISNVRDYATAAVAQHVFAGLLNLYTAQDHYRKAASDGTWSQSPQFCPLTHSIHELAGKHMVILGYGVLGKAVAGLAEAFGMDVSVARRPGSDDKSRSCLKSLLPLADIVSIHCPLTRQTRGIVGTEELDLLDPHAIIVNTARGGIVDEPALVTALRENKLGGAVIDVLSTEPPPPDHPLLATNIPNLILTPHTAWASVEARQRLLKQMAENVTAWKNQRPIRQCSA
ncbi:MAG: D-2-hydroxyacid dehydrogenase [bacterium]